ncbi:MAG: class I SAM-dependent methyltransferase [Acetobacteraceae bacterium]
MTTDATQESFWSDSWAQHIETYLAAPPRCGYWLEARFGLHNSVLELAGGSCRDSRYLAARGASAVGSDFDEKTLAYLEDRFPNSTLQLRREDGYALSFRDNSVDLSFSNGFWVYPDPDRLRALAFEQARVTRKWMVVLVHNALNERLVDSFRRAAQADRLYDIRFFDPDEIAELIRSFEIPHSMLSVHKFGGPVDALLYQRLARVPNPISRASARVIPHIYRWQPWRQTERIACVLQLS